MKPWQSIIPETNKVWSKILLLRLVEIWVMVNSLGTKFGSDHSNFREFTYPSIASYMSSSFWAINKAMPTYDICYWRLTHRWLTDHCLSAVCRPPISWRLPVNHHHLLADSRQTVFLGELLFTLPKYDKNINWSVTFFKNVFEIHVISEVSCQVFAHWCLNIVLVLLFIKLLYTQSQYGSQ